MTSQEPPSFLLPPTPSRYTSLTPAGSPTETLVYLKSLLLNLLLWRLWTSLSAAYVYFIIVVQCGNSCLFFFDQTTFGLTPNGQIWPRALNSDIGGVAGAIYLIVGNLGSPSGEGFDFINGQTFLERFYAVFDTANKRVGLATTPFTDATTNWHMMITIQLIRTIIFDLDIMNNFWNQCKFLVYTLSKWTRVLVAGWSTYIYISLTLQE